VKRGFYFIDNENKGALIDYLENFRLDLTTSKNILD
jgi:hypothetical protein